MEEKDEIAFYGRNAAEWLKRWDEGKTVWSIEMGGLGPGYEQCIHVTVAEMLRHMLKKQYDVKDWGTDEGWKRDLKQIEKAAGTNKRIKSLGLSGAQYGAALNLASNFYRQGPRAVMTDDRVKDRHIQVSSSFPVMAT